MFITFGTPNHRLSEIDNSVHQGDLKRTTKIAVIDDEVFTRAPTLRTHGFIVEEVGGDIRSVDQVAAYPVVVCDIRGVGRAFDSEYEGAHVIAELRKAYPDKYLIAFTGMLHNIKYNKLLSAADDNIAKDAPMETWNDALNTAIVEVGSPLRRWIRFRTHLARDGYDAYKIFLLEQAFIAAYKEKNPELMKKDSLMNQLPTPLRTLAGKFAETALTALITAALAS
jgi:hypothetical protein